MVDLKKKFVVIAAMPRSGSTLLMRAINRFPKTNIFGENFYAIRHLHEFFRSIEKILSWPSRGYKVPTTRQDYEQERSHAMAWYNEFDIGVIKSTLKEFLFRIFDPTDQHQIIGFKEIRFGLVTNDDVQHDLFNIVSFDKFEKQLNFLKLVFGNNLKLILLIRKDIEGIKSSKWNCFKGADINNKLFNLISHYEQYYKFNPSNSILFEYGDFTKSSRMDIERLIKFIDVDIEPERVVSELNLRTR